MNNPNMDTAGSTPKLDTLLQSYKPLRISPEAVAELREVWDRGFDTQTPHVPGIEIAEAVLKEIQKHPCLNTGEPYFAMMAGLIVGACGGGSFTGFIKRLDQEIVKAIQQMS